MFPSIEIDRNFHRLGITDGIISNGTWLALDVGNSWSLHHSNDHFYMLQHAYYLLVGMSRINDLLSHIRMILGRELLGKSH